MIEAAESRTVSRAEDPTGSTLRTISPRQLQSSSSSENNNKKSGHSPSSSDQMEWASLWNQRRSKRLKGISMESTQKKKRSPTQREVELMAVEPPEEEEEESAMGVVVVIRDGEEQDDEEEEEKEEGRHQVGEAEAKSFSVERRLVGSGRVGAFEPRLLSERVAGGEQTTATRRLGQQQMSAAKKKATSSLQHQPQQLMPPPGAPAEKTKNKNKIKSATLAPIGGSNAPMTTSSSNSSSKSSSSSNNIGTKPSKSDASVRYNTRPKRINAGKHTEIWRNKWMTH